MCFTSIAFAEISYKELPVKQLDNIINNENNPDALYELGNRYYKNLNGIGQDYNKAHGLFLKAAEKQHVKSYFKLFKMNLLGLGTKKDEKKAGYWLKKIENTEERKYDFFIGIGYLEAKYGYQRSQSKGVKYLESSALQEQDWAYAPLGVAYMTVEDEKIRDIEKAFYWLSKVKDKSDRNVNFFLGGIYLEGVKGLKPDLKKSYFHLYLARQMTGFKEKYKGQLIYKLIDENIQYIKSKLDNKELQKIEIKAAKVIMKYNK